MIDLHLLKHYLKTILDIDITPRPWTAAEQLPFYLRTAYAFYQINILGVDCLLAFDENPATASPATISKHLDQIKIKWTGDVIYVRSAVSAGYRNRMIRQKIPFIIPNNQMFLPMFGMDIREYFKKIKITPVALSPSAQCLILFLLIRGYSPGSMITLRHVAQSLDYSLMTISRVFDELTALELAQSVREGRDRKLRVLFPAVKLWEKSLPYLTTPVQQRVILSSLDADIPISLAGLSALAESTRCYLRRNIPQVPSSTVTGIDSNIIFLSTPSLIPKQVPGKSRFGNTHRVCLP